MPAKDASDAQRVKQAPLLISNLENSYLREHGEGLLNFNQNTVPFDFDGKRLLWLEYQTRENRNVYIYHFDTKEAKIVLTFDKTDGLVSHMKFIGDKIFYIGHTRNVMVYDMNEKKKQQIG